ncbi:excisionase family DNA-binding protein [Spirillospora sp. NPDC049652]
MTTKHTQTPSSPSSAAGERLLTIAEAAVVFNTSERFPRRLVAERRIRFVKLGRFVRIPESAAREFIAKGLVEPLTVSTVRRVA